MDIRAEADIPASRLRVFPIVADLTTYPDWLTIVLAVAVENGPDDEAWLVDIGAGFGPLRRAKRVRMIQDRVEKPSGVRFVRCELDGADHSPWILSVDLAARGRESCHMEGRLHYGGNLWIPGLDQILQRELRRAGDRLTRLVSGVR